MDIFHSWNIRDHVVDKRQAKAHDTEDHPAAWPQCHEVCHHVYLSIRRTLGHDQGDHLICYRDGEVDCQLPALPVGEPRRADVNLLPGKLSDHATPERAVPLVPSEQTPFAVRGTGRSEREVESCTQGQEYLSQEAVLNIPTVHHY